MNKDGAHESTGTVLQLNIAFLWDNSSLAPSSSSSIHEYCHNYSEAFVRADNYQNEFEEWCHSRGPLAKAIEIFGDEPKFRQEHHFRPFIDMKINKKSQKVVEQFPKIIQAIQEKKIRGSWDMVIRLIRLATISKEKKLKAFKEMVERRKGLDGNKAEYFVFRAIDAGCLLFDFSSARIIETIKEDQEFFWVTEASLDIFNESGVESRHDITKIVRSFLKTNLQKRNSYSFFLYFGKEQFSLQDLLLHHESHMNTRLSPTRNILKITMETSKGELIEQEFETGRVITRRTQEIQKIQNDVYKRLAISTSSLRLPMAPTHLESMRSQVESFKESFVLDYLFSSANK